ncbi:hypothetical protein [Ferruginibacter profundus]
MKTTIVFFSSLLLWQFSFAQENKVVKKAQQVNNKSQQVSETSDKVKEQAGMIANNTKNAVQNAKAVIKIFEPIFAIHFKKKNKKSRSANDNDNVVIDTKQVKSDPGNNNTNPSQGQPVSDNNFPVNNNNNGQPVYNDPGVPENTNYNPDGSANLGNQYNAEYGCYLDALTGTVLFGGDAEEKPTSVDLIFLAPNDGQNTYYLVTPNFAHDGGADCFWGSCTTDNPVKSWKTVNESEVAVTTLTGAQFEKIQYNTQLSGAVKGTRGFAGWYSSPGNKLDGKVFAVKTEMENRTAYALIYVVKQVGTSGSGGYLKVKIKVTGMDTNGDGDPDTNVYESRN